MSWVRFAGDVIAAPPGVYSVSFEYKRSGVWTSSTDHRCVVIERCNLVRYWSRGGYGELRNVVVWKKSLLV